MEDCQQLLLNPLHVHSSGSGGEGVPSASPSPPYPEHSQQLQQPQHEPARSHSLHEQVSLSSVKNHALHHLHPSLLLAEQQHLFSAQDPLVNNMSRQDGESCTCENDTSVQSANMMYGANMDHFLQQTGSMDAELLKPHASNSMHAPKAIRPINVASHCQKSAGVGHPSNSEASTTTPPQHCCTQHMMLTFNNSDSLKKRRGRGGRKPVVTTASAFPLPTTAETTHQFGERCQTGALVQGLIPYVITIARGEDVLLRLTSFQQGKNWKFCVLSALGSISNVILRHSEAPSGIITYEGCYDILALSGPLLPRNNEDFQSRGGGLMVSLAGLDGRVFGGEVTGVFVAASPIKVIVGTLLDANRNSMQGGDLHNMLLAETATALSTIPMHRPIY